MGAKYIEFIHDELVAKLWPGGDPIASGEYRSDELLESAAGRPFHSAFGKDAYPGVKAKAAALFHSLISNHPFHNGNKRTAVLAVGSFLVANGYFLLLSNEEMYALAETTASYRERKRTHDESLQAILAVLEEAVISLAALKKEAKTDRKVRKLYETAMQARLHIRRNKFNSLLTTE